MTEVGRLVRMPDQFSPGRGVRAAATPTCCCCCCCCCVVSTITASVVLPVGASRAVDAERRRDPAASAHRYRSAEPAVGYTMLTLAPAAILGVVMVLIAIAGGVADAIPRDVRDELNDDAMQVVYLVSSIIGLVIAIGIGASLAYGGARLVGRPRPWVSPVVVATYAAAFAGEVTLVFALIVNADDTGSVLTFVLLPIGLLAVLLGGYLLVPRLLRSV